VHGERSAEGGFVLLTLLFFAAAVAFMLVLALPRTAMQSQRVREETLIYRGEQYKRAVQLYFRKYQKYPESLDDLEESDGIRFLRRRYKDPLTGEDEWRLVHMGSDGRFKDSLLFDQEEEEGEGQGRRRGARDMGAGGRINIGGQPGVTTSFRGADRARAAQDSAAPDLTGQQPSAAEYMAAGFEGQPGADGNPAAQGEQPQDGAAPNPTYATTLPSQIPSPTGAGRMAPPGAVNPYPQAVPGVAAGQGLPTNQSSTNRRGSRQGQLARNPANMIGGVPQAGGQPGAPVGRSAADLIRNLLTTPRPGGLAGLRGGPGNQQPNRPNFAEGIAGVASKVQERGVKVYNEREFYNEWEFVYDYRQDAALAGIPGAGGPGMGNLNPSQPGLGPGGGLQIDPSQGVPMPGMPGAAGPGAAPADGMAQPPSPYPQSPGVPPLPGTSPFEPNTGAPYPQPNQPAQPTDTDRSNRSSRRLRYPVPLPGQPIGPGANDPTQPTTAPGQPPFGLPPGDPNQPAPPDNSGQP
jgi:type II secretory pathway pseudopilin PulG